MCIDYTDLNKAILKKLFTMPQIEEVIDAVAGYEILCFCDAYKRYHQIPMAIQDMENTSFVTDDGIFSYTQTTFRLKNAGAKF